MTTTGNAQSQHMLEYKLLEKAKTFARERHETTSYEAWVPIWTGIENMGLPGNEELRTVYDTITHIDTHPVPLQDIRAELNAPAKEFANAALAAWHRMKRQECLHGLEKACTDTFESEFRTYIQDHATDLHALLVNGPPAESRALAQLVTPESPTDWALRNAVRTCLARSEPDYASLYERSIDGNRHFIAQTDLEIHEKKLCARVPALLEKTFVPGVNPDAIYKKLVTALSKTALMEQSPAEARIERETWRCLNKTYFAAMIRHATYKPEYCGTLQHLLDSCAAQTGKETPRLALPTKPEPHKLSAKQYVLGFTPTIAGIISCAAGFYSTAQMPHDARALASAGIIAGFMGSVIAGVALTERIEKANTLRNDTATGEWRQACAQETARYLRTADAYLKSACRTNTAYYPCAKTS